MVDQRNARRGRGMHRPGPAERERTREEKRLWEAERKRDYRRRKRERDLEVAAEVERERERRESAVCNRIASVEGETNARDVRRAVHCIVGAVKQTLQAFPGPKAKEVVLRKVWEHPVTTEVFPEHLRRSNAEMEILSGLVQTLGEVKQPRTTAELATKHAILTAVVSAGNKESLRKKARVLNIHHRNVSAAIERRRKMSTAAKFHWMLSVRAIRANVLSPGTKEIVIAWWCSETRMSPNRKEVVKKSLGGGLSETQAAQYLLETQMEFFMRFQEANPTVIVGKRMFDSLKPFFIKALKEKNVCCCIYHVEMDGLRIAFNFMRLKSGFHNSKICECFCEEVCQPEGEEVCACPEPCRDSDHVCCKGRYLTYAGTTELIEAILCPREEFHEYHRRACIYGECSECGVDFLPLCPREVAGESEAKVQWKHFAMQEITTKRGETRKKLQLVYKVTSSDEFLSYFKPKLQFFVQHSFVAKWQDRQFRNCLENFPEDSIVSVVDFAENYSFEVQNKVQSMHWHSYQVSILLHINWMRNPNPDPHDESSCTIMKYHFYVSDDKQHDSYFVQHCLMLHWDDLVATGFVPKRHFIWSDGCSSQFKSKILWYFVSRYPQITSGCTCLWSFFGSGHGKGPHNGAGAVLKRYIRQAQLDAFGPQLQNAQNIVSLLRAKLSGRPKTCSTYTEKRLVHRTFWHIWEGDIDRVTEYVCDTIAGTRDLHSVRSVSEMDVHKLLKRSLACFCSACMVEDWGNCVNREWCRDWAVEVLRTDTVGYVQATMADAFTLDLWDDYGTDGAYLASCLQLRDNFATQAEANNDEGVDFYLLLCTKQPYIAEKPFTCAWGERFVTGDMVVEAKYYQKWGSGARNYVYLAKFETAHVHPSDIRALKFPLVPQIHRVQGNDPVYALPISVEGRIRHAMRMVD